MSLDDIENVIRTLAHTVSDLEMSVMHAYEQFVVKYGAGHVHVSRIESYFSAIDKQREYIDQLSICVKSKDFVTFHELSSKVRALSEMIKNDAKCLLSYMSTGTHAEFQEEQVH